MSTEAPSLAAPASKKEKRKKEKEKNSERSTKRNRGSEHREDDGDNERSSKKRKKNDESKHDGPLQPQPQSATKSSKKRDKDKSKSKTSQSPKEELLKTQSPFVRQITSFYLPLSPCASAFPLEGLCAEHLSPLLLTYYPPLRGILMAYENAQMSTERPEANAKTRSIVSASHDVLSKSIDEYGVTFVWLTADFLLFRPRKGTWIEGYVNLQNESLLGLVCYNYFNAVIEREKLPQDWRWVEDTDVFDYRNDSPKKKRRKFGESGGYFVDDKGDKVEGRIIFRVEDFEASAGVDGGGGSVSIVGTLANDTSKS